jgi:Fe2+ or Zn2+ uptake regulation protein
MQHYLIHREMIQEATGLDPTSIYRVLDVLEKLHIIRKIHSNSTYVTIPESLRADEHIAIYIDESTHSIDIKALNAVRDDDFSLSASHIELRGT